MHTSRRRTARGGLTLIEVVVIVFLVAVLAGILSRNLREQQPRRIRCRNNLQRLAKGMATYLSEYGNNTWFPCPLGRGQTPGDYNGAEWLASLYWTEIVPDPDVFLCPSTTDSNNDGRDIGEFRAAPTFGPQTVSYAGMHYRSLRDGQDKPIPGAISVGYPPDKPMASDDTQGGIHHGSAQGMGVLYFDSRVDFRTFTELDLRTCVGDTDPDALLRDLRN